MARVEFERYKDLINEIGKQGLNALFPDEFEYYLITLELTTSDDKTIDYFSFPVNPKSMTKTDPQVTNIKKTASGVTTLNNNTFVPQDLNIQGDFGRRFKVLLGQQNIIDFAAVAYSNISGILKKQNNKLTVPKPIFNVSIKTGYGCLKYLQSICDKSVGLDNNEPRKLYLYNPALGENYLVKVAPAGLTMTMNSRDSNMIWNYTLPLKVVGRMEDIRGKNIKTLVNSLLSNNIQIGMNKIATKVRRSFI